MDFQKLAIKLLQIARKTLLDEGAKELHQQIEVEWIFFMIK